MNFKLKPLPYAKSALEPHVSERTVSFHYEKHHAGYVDKLNDAVANTPLANKSLEAVVVSQPEQSIYNLAAQVWNHDFYWRSMHPEQSKPSVALSQLVDNQFGSGRKFEEQFKKTAMQEFGSGWAWLSFDRNSDSLVISSTSDAGCPLGGSLLPLLTIDVWEHAYYLDYQNDRAAYVEHALTHLLNWEHASAQLEQALEAA